MKELFDLLNELQCDINYCKVSGENDTEIKNANETLVKIRTIIKSLIKSGVIKSICLEGNTPINCNKFLLLGNCEKCNYYNK